MSEHDKVAAAILTQAYLKAFQEMSATEFKTEVLKEDNSLPTAIERYVKNTFKSFNAATA
jgi:hypothetical protein